MADIGEIVATLRADTKQFTDGLAQSKTSLLAFGASSVAVGELAAQALTAIGSAALHALTAIGRWAAEAGAAAERTERLSMQIGIQERVIEGWSVALNRVGLQQESLSMSMRTLSRHMVGLQEGQEKSVELFAKLGLSMSQAETAGNDTQAVLRTVADKFVGMNDGAEKARLAVELFGRSGLQLIPLLNQGAAGIDAATKKAEEFGLVLTESQRTSLKNYDDSLDDISSALQGFRTQVAAAFSPSLEALVKLFTQAVAGATNIVKEFAAAFDKLTTRLGAMVASIEIIAKQLFSFSALSKEAWKETLQMVEAIDKDTAAKLKAIDAGDKAAATQRNFNEAVKDGVTHQKVLGEQIVASTKIILAQQEERKKSQERMGRDIVSGTQIAVKIAEEEEAVQRRANGNFQAYLARKIIEESLAEDRAVGNLQQYLGKRIVLETQYENRAIDHAQENMGRWIVTQEIARQKALHGWDDFGKLMNDSMAFAFGSIRTQFANTITQYAIYGGKFADLWKGIAATILGTVVQLGIQMVANAAVKNALLVTGEATTAGAMTAIWTGATAAITGLFATVSSAILGLITGTIFPALIEAGTAVITFLSSIASALDASIFGIPFSVPVWAAVALVAAAIGTIAAFAFADGGVVTKPTLGLVGEAGPEAIIPLNQMKNFGGGPTTVIVELDGKVLMRHVANHLPSVLRLKGLPA
jgi:uncharacterized coiled-coil protein SlyX